MGIYSEKKNPARKRNFFHQHMIDFVSILEPNNQKYRSYGTLIDENYKGKLLFPMEDFVLFGNYHQSMLFMSNISLKENIDGIYAPKFKLAYICNTTIHSHKELIKFFCNVKYMWRGKQYLEL